MNIHYAKFEYEGMNTVGRLHKLGTPTHFRWKQCLCSTLIKNEKQNMKCAQNTWSTSSMCVNDHCVKIEYKGMNTVRVIDYTS